MNLYISPNDLDSSSEVDSDDEGAMMSADDALFDNPFALDVDSDSEADWAPGLGDADWALDDLPTIEIGSSVVVLRTTKPAFRRVEEKPVHFEDFVQKALADNLDLYEKHKVDIDLDVSPPSPPLPPPPLPHSLALSTDVTRAVFSPAAAILAVADYGGKILLYDFDRDSSYSSEGSRFLATIDDQTTSIVTCLAFSPDGSTLIVAHNDGDVWLHSLAFEQKTSKVGHTENSVLVKNAYKKSCGVRRITCVKCVGNKSFATGDENGVVCLWDHRERGRALVRWRLGEGEISDLIVGDDGKGIIACCKDGAVGKYDVPAQRLMEEHTFSTPISCMALLRHDTRLVLGDASGRIQVCGGRLDEPSQSLPTGSGITAISAVSDTRFIAADTAGEVRYYSVSPLTLLGTLPTTLSHRVQSLSVSCDVSSAVATCGSDVVTVIDLHDELVEVAPAQKTLRKSEGKMTSTDEACSSTSSSSSFVRPDR